MRALRLSFAALVCAAVAAPAFAASTQSFPSRPVRIIVPFPPGSGTDIVARPIAQRLTDVWHQPIIVDNRAGAGGTIAGDLVAKANPDGYTLLLGNVSMLAIARSLYPKLTYDPLRDFAPITLLTTSENVIVVHPSVPVDSVKSLIAYAKAHPRELIYASAGSGTTTHLGGAMFCSMAGVEMTHVPYKGSAQVLADLLGGQTQVSFSSVPTALPHIKSGRLRAIAVTRLKRSTTLPDLPTVDESGLRGFDISLWQAIVAPAGTSRDIVMTLNRQIVSDLGTPALKAQFAAQGLDAVGNTPEQFAGYLRDEVQKWAKVVKASGAKPE